MQRYFAKEKVDNNIVLDEKDIHHIKHVMRMNVNDKIEVISNKKIYLCNIDNIKDFKISIDKELSSKEENLPFIRLIIPNLKEQKMDLILQKATEIGVSEIVIVPFNRSMVKLEERKEKVKLDRWNRIVKEASEQSFRLDIPLITIEKNFDFTKKLDGVKLICSTNEKDNSIKNALKKASLYDKITIVIGPEGGLAPFEEDYLEGIGFSKITLGSQILRVETVPIFITSIIKYEYME